jgi:3-oxoacyl-[acyl-carrier protein] reductase
MWPGRRTAGVSTAPGLWARHRGSPEYDQHVSRRDFAGCEVLVTGGTRGIGLGIATAFADEDARVTVTGTRGGSDHYPSDLSRFRYLRCRMDAADVQAVADATPELDVLINNAGQSRPDGQSEWSPDVFDRVVATDLLAVFRLTTACKAALRPSEWPGGASVVNVVSLSAFGAVPVVIGYGAAKAGLNQLTKGLAVSWAADGIRVNAIAPGLIATDFSAGMTSDPEASAAFLTRIPQRRFGVPDDVAPAALFLSSAGASFITGATLVIDGGQLAQL